MTNKASIDFQYQSKVIQSNMHKIKDELDSSPKTDKKYQALTQKLDATLKILLTIKNQFASTVFVISAADAMQKEIVTLYGRVTDEWMKSKVCQIQDKAVKLEQSLTRGKVTAEAVQTLTMKLQAFKKEHRPSIEDRRAIAHAEEILIRAHAFLQGDFEVNQESCAQIAPSQEEIDYGALEGAEQLMNIASYIYMCDKQRAKKEFFQLPDDLKSRFLEAMHQLDKAPFTDAVETMQVLIALANELVNNGEGAPSLAELDELFSDLSHVLEEEKSEVEHFSFRSKESLGG